MDLIAVTTIHRTKKPGKDPVQPGGKKIPPETEIVMPGESFTAKNKGEAEELIGLGAAREDKGKKASSKKAPAKNTKSSSAAAAKQQAKKDGPRDPEDMTMDEIKAELDTLEAGYSSSDDKAALVKALTDARSGGLV